MRQNNACSLTACLQLKFFANSLGLDQSGQNVGLDLNHNCLSEFISWANLNVSDLWFGSLHPSHSYGHVGTVSSPNHTFFPGQA